MKILEILLRKLFIKLVVLIICLFIPGLNVVLAILIPLFLLLIMFKSVIENFLLIIIGLLIYFIMFSYSSDIYIWYKDMLNIDLAKLLSFLTGFVIIFTTTRVIKLFGYTKSKVEIVLLSFPVFICTFFLSLILAGKNTSTDF